MVNIFVRGKKKGIIILLFGVCFLNSCNVDLLGFFGSNDLNIRLKEKNYFPFLNPGNPNDPPLPITLGEEYSFIVLTDTHIERGNAFGLEKLKDAIDSNNNDSKKLEIKFAIICGDITQTGYQEELDKFMEIAASLEIPFYPVIGNHDIYSGNWTNWKKSIGSTRYRIDGGNTTLIILDSANCYFGNEQLNWLEEELEIAQGRVFVFTHANLFMDNPVEFQQLTDNRERARLISLLQGRCDAMFMGHSHLRYVKKNGDVQFITAEDFRSKDIYCQVSVTKTEISWEFKKPD